MIILNIETLYIQKLSLKQKSDTMKQNAMQVLGSRDIPILLGCVPDRYLGELYHLISYVVGYDHHQT